MIAKIPALAVDIPARAESYEIYIGRAILEGLPSLFPENDYSKIIVFADENVAAHWLERLTKGYSSAESIVFQGGEENKSIATVESFWRKLGELGADRYSLIVALGGGLTGDIVGFAASTFMRGVRYVQVPTSLLAQVDASIGGKVGINFSQTKNLLGAFSQPAAVIIDLETLTTLPRREFLSGFAEVVKHGLIDNPVLLEMLEKHTGMGPGDPALAQLIHEAIVVKKKIVEEDERESGRRKILNFGHTLGHALEVMSHEMGVPLLHGEAVSLGIVGELALSEEFGSLSGDRRQRVRALLKQLELPVVVPFQVPRERLLALMKRDKKNKSRELRWVQMTSLGVAAYDVSLPDEAVDRALDAIGL